MADYSESQLKELAKLAAKLGFWDDYAHWQALLREKRKSVSHPPPIPATAHVANRTE